MVTRHFTTGLLHSDRRAGIEHGATRKPVHNTVQFAFRSTDDIMASFQGRLKGAFHYARNGSPTAAALETKINDIEGGVATICFSTGMAAISATFFSLLRAGDHVVAGRSLFSNTANVMKTLSKFGVTISLVDATRSANVASALTDRTRLVFVETISNPLTHVADLAAIGEICFKAGVLFVVDNTVTSAALFQPRSVGAGIVINSLTKIVGGHGAALGGSVTDTGMFDWRPFMAREAVAAGTSAQGWGAAHIRKAGLRDLGGTLAPEQANLLSLGLDTLELRAGQASHTALALACFLEGHPSVARVNYPGLSSHGQHELVATLFRSPSWLLSFEMKSVDRVAPVLDRLRLAVISTGLGDARTLVIPVAPTIFHEFTPDERRAMGITDGLVRVSAGLEATDELISDFSQALQE